MKDLVVELKSLKETGIDGHPVKLYFCSDWKFLAIIYGLSGPAADVQILPCSDFLFSKSKNLSLSVVLLPLLQSKERRCWENVPSSFPIQNDESTDIRRKKKLTPMNNNQQHPITGFG